MAPGERLDVEDDVVEVSGAVMDDIELEGLGP
jgi:hypothetical protein